MFWWRLRFKCHQLERRQLSAGGVFFQKAATLNLPSHLNKVNKGSSKRKAAQQVAEVVIGSSQLLLLLPPLDASSTHRHQQQQQQPDVTLWKRTKHSLLLLLLLLLFTSVCVQVSNQSGGRRTDRANGSNLLRAAYRALPSCKQVTPAATATATSVNKPKLDLVSDTQTHTKSRRKRRLLREQLVGDRIKES